MIFLKSWHAICAAETRENEYLTLSVCMHTYWQTHFSTTTPWQIPLGWAVKFSSEVILSAESIREESCVTMVSPWYQTWLKPTLSVTWVQEHLTYLLMLRANCPIFKAGPVPSCDIFPIAVIYLSNQQMLPKETILQSGRHGEEENYSAIQSTKGNSLWIKSDTTIVCFP